MHLNTLSNASTDRLSEDSPPDAVVAWSLQRFADQRLIMTTSFGMEGCALLDMYARHGRPLQVYYIDTGFFFAETLRLRDRMAERYPHVELIRAATPLSPEDQAARHGPELWKTNPDLCCHLRKVLPMADVMRGVDVWITGLRRSQSKSRGTIRMIDWDWQYQVLKVSPLANWGRGEVWEYIQKHDVPYNALHEQGYPTVGCTHCTKPVPGSKPWDYSRDGRWTGTGKTECGLHGAGI